VEQARERLKTQTVEVSAVVVLWVLLFEVNRWLFAYFESSPFANWVFLPAALRVVAVLLLGWRGALGLFLGAFFTNYPHLGHNMLESLVLAALSASSPLVGVLVARRLLRIQSDLAGLSIKDLLYVAAICATLSAVAHNAYFHQTSADHRWAASFLPMLIGDLIGTLLFLYAASAVERRIKRRSF